MQIAPVNYDHLIAPFDYMSISRVTPTGRVDRLHVSRRFRVHVRRDDGSAHRFQLDADQAEDLVHALPRLLQAQGPGTEHSATAPGIDIEIGWRGRSVHLHALAWPEDEAVAGVVQFARHALGDARPEDDPITSRRLDSATPTSSVG